MVFHRGGGMGDLLMLTPLLSALKGFKGVTHPIPHLSVMLRASLRAVLEGNPDVDEILADSPKFRGVRGWQAFASFLKKKKFDIAVFPWTTAQDAWGAYLAGIPVRVGQDGRLLYSFLFTHRVRVRSTLGDAETNWSEILLDYARIIGIEPPPPKLFLDVPPEAMEKAEGILKESGYQGERPLIALHAFKGMPLTASRWPLGWFARLADLLGEKFGGRVLLTGGFSEVPLVTEIKKLMKRPALDLSGKTSLKELAAVLGKCDLLVCPDSGPMHIAAALGVPVVGIFALKEDFPGRWGPLGTRYEVVRPQSWRCSRKCVKEKCPKISCYEEIPPEKILEAVERLGVKSSSLTSSKQDLALQIELENVKDEDLTPCSLCRMGNGGRETEKSAVSNTIRTSAVFLDRDGTIIEDADFLADPEDISFIKGAPEALSALQKAGFKLVLISNQSGVARGYFTEEAVQDVHRRLEELLESRGVKLDGVYYCPHLPDGAVEKYRLECNCRKPKTGMIRRAVEELGVDPARSFCVGDKESDIEAGRAAGCRTVLVLTGKGLNTSGAISLENRPDFIAKHIGEAAEWILGQKGMG
ncbi:MAG: D-glycero-beta-D-manno-heptose 1,7-bisphosphate 7-phosphatase [bacterium]